jgi:hypothetical protein
MEGLIYLLLGSLVALVWMLANRPGSGVDDSHHE